MNYRELPQAAWTRCADHFSTIFTAKEIEVMRETAHFNAKRPKQSFVADTADKQRTASAELRQLAAHWLTLDEIRAVQARHRSSLVLRCIEDWLAGRRYPLELLRHCACAG